MPAPSTSPSRIVPALAAGLSLALGFAAAAAARPPVQIVETRPVETALGDTALPDAQPVWLELIREAKTTLDIEQFYCSDWPGERLRPVLEEIGKAGARGVRVRLLLDRRMHDTYPMPADSMGRLPGVSVRVLDMARIAGGVQHSKYWIADRRVSFVGSQNLDWRALEHIHELGVRVDDARVADVFGSAFELDWAAADTSTRAAGRDTIAALRRTLGGGASMPPPFRIVQAPGDTAEVWAGYSPRAFLPDSSRWELPMMERLLDSAREEIVMQSLGYSTGGRGERDSTLDRALRRAAARGVKVRMLISDWASASSIEQLRSLARAGIEVKLSTLPEWSGGYIPFARVEHCKYAVVDGARAWIGSSNWEPGYFLGSRNLSLTIANRPLARQARGVFETGWNAPSAAPLKLEGTYPPKIRGDDPPPGHKKYGG